MTAEATRIVVVLAPGFEETEAVSVIDVLRRAEFDVAIAGLDGDGAVTGNHGITLIAEEPLRDVDGNEVRLVVLPGGMPGAQHLADSKLVCGLIRQVYDLDNLVAAICAAPIALHAAGVLGGKRVTSYPAFRDKLTGAAPTDALVERDGNVITSQGPGTALLFALELVRALGALEKADEIEKAMLV